MHTHFYPIIHKNECIALTFSIFDKVEGRKRTYLITEKGKEMLDTEYKRIIAQAQDYRAIFGKEEKS